MVTAERREQSLQDVPISATVLTTAELSRRGVQDVTNLQQVAPSITIAPLHRSVLINIRGVGMSQLVPTSSPGVAYYLDGQLIPHEQFIGQSFFDIGAIEVLRGPQGTLTGQNATGGAVFVRTPEPKFDATSGYVEQTVGDYDVFRTIAALNMAFNDNLALRVAGTHDERDSFSRNIGPSGSQPGDMKLDAVRANLAFRSNDERLKANLRGEFFDYRTGSVAVKNRADTVSGDPFVIEEDARAYLNQKGYRLSTEIRYDALESAQIRFLSSYQDGYTRDQIDGDRSATALPVPANLSTSGANTTAFPGRVPRTTTDFRTLINEINLISTAKGPLQWVVGAFSLDESIPVTSLRDNRSTTDFVQSNSTIQIRTQNTSTSLFGQMNWYVTPRVEVLAGGRHTWDRQISDRYVLQSVVQPANLVRGIIDTEQLTGKVGLSYHMEEGTLLYATASKGYRAGGVNTFVNTPNYEPERNIVYEAGAKTELFDRRLRINGDVFHSDYKDIQLQSLLQGLPLVQNAASGESWGAELELTGQFDALGLNAGVSYLDAEFSRTVCINNSNNPAGDRVNCPSSSATAADELVTKGSPLPYSPKWTINAGIQYAIDAGSQGVFTPRVQWSHLSEQLVTPFPSFRTIIGARDVFDARLTWDFLERYRIEAYVSNVTDETYVAAQVQASPTADGGYVYGAPRQYGLRATVRFGD